MEPLKPAQKQSILENSPSAQPGDVEEYERLLSTRYTSDPDFAPSEDPKGVEALVNNSSEQRERRIAELHEKLYGTVGKV
jgi:hypothetical protein